MENRDSKFNEVPVPNSNPIKTFIRTVIEGIVILGLTFTISAAIGGATYMAINGFEFGYDILEGLLRNVG